MCTFDIINCAVIVDNEADNYSPVLFESVAESLIKILVDELAHGFRSTGKLWGNNFFRLFFCNSRSYMISGLSIELGQFGFKVPFHSCKTLAFIFSITIRLRHLIVPINQPFGTFYLLGLVVA